MYYTCVVCGHKTLDSRHDWDICPVCFWEDDVLPESGDSQSPANGGLTIADAQAVRLLLTQAFGRRENAIAGRAEGSRVASISGGGAESSGSAGQRWSIVDVGQI
jgi:hypothetical protein